MVPSRHWISSSKLTPSQFGRKLDHQARSSMQSLFSLMSAEPLRLPLVRSINDWIKTLPCSATCDTHISFLISDCKSFKLMNDLLTHGDTSCTICLFLSGVIDAIMAVESRLTPRYTK